MIELNFEDCKPLSNQVLIKPDLEKEKIGMIYIPEDVKERMVYYGEVIKVGLGKITKRGILVPCEVKKGDRIIYSKYAGVEVYFKNDSNKYKVIREDLIWGTIE